MNCFVLCTGRCGSHTFAKACQHITNYTAAHESRSHLIGEGRLAYPPRHIEADNRLAWYLGRLEDLYGDKALYVHLTRETVATARSFEKRIDYGIMRAYREGILLKSDLSGDPLEVCIDYCNTVNANIRQFLATKSKVLPITLENAKEGYQDFWRAIGAEGNLQAALAEWDRSYDASPSEGKQPLLARIGGKAVRIVSRFPSYVRGV